MTELVAWRGKFGEGPVVLPELLYGDGNRPSELSYSPDSARLVALVGLAS